MPQPTRSDVHVNKPLTNISIAYIQDQKDFIADKIFPNVPVMQQSDRYFSYDKQYWFQSSAQKRADSAESAGAGFHVDNTPNYSADVFAVHKDVGEQIRANADAPLDLDRDATMFVTRQLLLRREKDFLAKYLAASTWTGDSDFTPGTLWSAAGSNPLDDIDAEKSKILSKTGFLPNTLVVTDDVFRKLKNNANIVDRIKYTQRGLITEDLLASLFGVDKFLVARAVQDSAAEGQASSMDFIVKNKGLLVYAAPSPGILQPSGGYIFSWSGLLGAGAQGTRVSSFYIPQRKCDRIEGEMAYDMKLVGADLGVYLTGLIA